MPKLIILRGNSGSGKTSVSKELQKRFGRNTLLISQDVVRREMLWEKDGAGNLALPLLMNLLEYGRKNCEISILEGILNSEWYAPLFEKALSEYGMDNISAFYYDLPFEETLLRHETKPNRHEFGEEQMRGWFIEKDFLRNIPERVITKDKSFSDTVDMIYNIVSAEIHNERTNYNESNI